MSDTEKCFRFGQDRVKPSQKKTGHNLCANAVAVLYTSEHFRAFILVKIVHCWPSPWSALRQNVPICLALCYLRLKPVGRYNSCSPRRTLPATHTHSHCHPSLSSLSLPFSFLLCQSRLCVSMALCCALWWVHFRHSCVSQERLFFQQISMGPLFVSLNLCHLLYLYFSIYCFPTKRTASFCESLCPPSVFTRSTTFSFSPSLFPSFD